MKRYVLVSAVTLAVALLIGCSSLGLVRDIKDTESALIFGHIDLTDAGYNLENVNLLKYKKVCFGGGTGGIGEPLRVYSDGSFFVENLDPGRYLLGGFTAGNVLHWNSKSTEKDVFTIKSGQIFYLGTFKYVPGKKAGFMSQATFSLERSKTPSERELLQWLIEMTKGTTWEAKIRARLKKLK